jgi:2-dehydro-3-deoxyphosphogluconate aldolase/(4S)-4-hydroxy-2-oxoglutarate aldolase
MDKRSELSNLVIEQGIMPLYYSDDTSVSIEVMRALYNAGIKTTEYANRGEQALKNFKEMRKAVDAEMPGMVLGIGTVKNGESTQTYIDEGAEFIVCPGTIESVIETSNKNQILCIPGCMTPTEIIQAEALGCKMIKLFPANTLGPGYIDAVQAVFSDIKFMPTGGIELNEANLRAWFKSGVIAVGGSKMITKAIMENHQYEELTAIATDVFKLIQSIKN